MSDDIYTKLNEGLGGAYERIAYSNVIKRVIAERGCKTILELGASFIAGIPGFNSCLLAQAGHDVTVLVHSRDYVDTKHVWELTGLQANIIQCDSYLETPFSNASFDFVWNHLAFEHYQDPTHLVHEMSRVSRDVVMNLTLAPYNPGFVIHYLTHCLQHKFWDHGYIRNSTIGAMTRVHRRCGLELLETGGADVPPWQDTVDAQLQGSMTYFDAYPKDLRDKWVWSSIDPRCQQHSLVKLFWDMEQTMPKWFKELVAHHLYAISTVGVK